MRYYLAEYKPNSGVDERRVIERVLRLELYAIYGGRDAYLRVPIDELAVDLLILAGKSKADEERNDRAKKDYERKHPPRMA